jgi:FkbM family methyltransferase
VKYRVAASVEHASVLDGLPGIRTVVDIGANVGQFALTARNSFPDSRIIAFEPLDGAARTWRSVFADDPHTTLIESAVGPLAGETVIHLSGRADSSSLLAITEKQDEIFPGTAGIGIRTIRVTRLCDSLKRDEIQTPALLKVDVQGYELQVLLGCEDLLDRFDWIYIECSFMELYAGQAFADQVIDWLRLRRFSLVGVYNMTYDNVTGLAVQGDFLFNRLSEAEAIIASTESDTPTIRASDLS